MFEIFKKSYYVISRTRTIFDVSANAFRDSHSSQPFPVHDICTVYSIYPHPPQSLHILWTLLPPYSGPSLIASGSWPFTLPLFWHMDFFTCLIHCSCTVQAPFHSSHFCSQIFSSASIIISTQAPLVRAFSYLSQSPLQPNLLVRGHSYLSLTTLT